jgi:putative ubiquitin-RnfH superfamily antitoxin RatB of RatAB toxin-antitoxin module
MISRVLRARAMADSARIRVDVAYALPDRQWLQRVDVPAGCVVADAIALSGIATQVAGVVVTDQNVGVFSRPVTLATVLNDGDRVEIYRPLTRDPKDTRRLRAGKQKRK